ncbi:MFS transporter [Caldifermentibacillus hisashii]|uniref:MFS transporter n=1 Tax=Caldifermentibacillus hisashii TaxID=996558 RepID=UPI0031FC766E
MRTSWLFSVVGLVFLDRLSLGFVFPYMSSELELSNTQLGLAVGLTGVFFGLSTLLFASISDFIGRKKMLLVIFVMIFSTATLLAGFVGSFAALLLTRIIMGIAEGPVMPLVQSIVYAESSERRRGFNMGIIQSASSFIGGMMAPVIAVALAVNFGWRSSFIYIAIPGLIVGLILWRFLREPKISQNITAEATTEKPKREAYFNVFKQRNIWLSTIVGTCNMIYILTLTAFLPTLFTTSTSFKEGQIQLLLGLMGFMMFVGQFGGPALSDRIGRLPVIKIFSFISIFYQLQSIFPIKILLFYLQE